MNDVLIILYSEKKRPKCICAITRAEAKTMLDCVSQDPRLHREIAATLDRLVASVKARGMDFRKITIGINVLERGIVTASKTPLNGRAVKVLAAAMASPVTTGMELLKARLRQYMAGGPGGVFRPFFDAEHPRAIIIPGAE
ncbi:MAG: hypothetical protein IT428_15215 [Planctomycetaceae bacterium]|nr:hypothetical protein [Planctomycetaceae bacterium]